MHWDDAVKPLEGPYVPAGHGLAVADVQFTGQ
jgi:hypothetical protein